MWAEETSAAPCAILDHVPPHCALFPKAHQIVESLVSFQVSRFKVAYSA